MIYKIEISRDLLDIFMGGSCVKDEGVNYFHYPFTIRITDAELANNFNANSFVCDLYTKNELPNDIREILYDEKRTNKKDK